MEISQETLEVLRDAIMFKLRCCKDAERELGDDCEENKAFTDTLKPLINAANEIGCNIDWNTLDPDAY